MWPYLFAAFQAACRAEDLQCRAAVGGEPLAPQLEAVDRARPVLPVRLEPAFTGCGQVVDLQPRSDGAWWVVDQRGWVSVTDQGRLFAVPVTTGGERGLLGLAVLTPEDRQESFFLYFTREEDGQLKGILEEWRGSGEASPPTLYRRLLAVDQPWANHNGGQVAFGEDGRLYLGLGDGGSGGDPKGAGQDPGTLLGKILRLDVDAPAGALAPADNPFVAREGFRPEIFALGLRNPWRMTEWKPGLWIVADVGQNRWEEVSLLQAGDNAGWRVREGAGCFPEGEACAATGLKDPVWTYGRSEGSSITGGVVVEAEGPLRGLYLVGDYVSGRLWALRLPEGAGPVEAMALGRFNLRPTAFSRALDGSVLVADHRGTLYRIVPTGGAVEAPAGG